MFNCTINKKKHVIHTNFNEITLRQLHKGYEYLQIAPVEILEYLKPVEEGVEKTVNASLFLDFQIHWISLFSDIPKDVLQMVNPVGMGTMSIEHAFSYVKKFIYSPEEYFEVKSFTLKEKKYDLVGELTSISGAKTYFSDGTYNQFKLSNMISTQISGDKKPATVEGLIQLLAVLYTNEGNNSNEAINEKIGLFWDVDALTGWSSYFFFVQSVHKWKDFFNSYMGKTTYRKQRKATLKVIKELLLKQFKKAVFGKYWNLKLQKWAFSIMDWKE